MNKQNVAYLFNRILLGKSMEWGTDNCYYMNEPKNCMLHKESQS